MGKLQIMLKCTNKGLRNCYSAKGIAYFVYYQFFLKSPLLNVSQLNGVVIYHEARKHSTCDRILNRFTRKLSPR